MLTSKKGLALVTAIFLAFGTAFSAQASNDCKTYESAQYDGILEALSCLKMQNDLSDFENIDFSDLYLGNPIQTYIYSDNALVPSKIAYPIICNNKLGFWAIEVNGKYQISQGLVDEINKCISADDAFAIVYDYDSVYLSTDSTLNCIGHYEGWDNTRSKIDTESVIDERIQLASLSKDVKIEFTNSQQRQIYYYCDVDYVTQFIPGIVDSASYICWAATIACIVNYHNGTSLTAVDVAQAIKGNDYNHGMAAEDYYYIVQYFRNNSVGTDLTCQITLPSIYSITDNIQNDYPIYSVWQGPSSWHASCLYGIFTTNNYISIMDPQVGFVEVPAITNTSIGAGYCAYSYYSIFSACTWNLLEAIYYPSFS